MSLFISQHDHLHSVHPGLVATQPIANSSGTRYFLLDFSLLRAPGSDPSPQNSPGPSSALEHATLIGVVVIGVVLAVDNLAEVITGEVTSITSDIPSITFPKDNSGTNPGTPPASGT